VRKSAGEFIKAVVEHLQRKRGRELEQAKVRVKHGDTYGEITLLGGTAFIVRDMDAAEKLVEKAAIQRDGSLGPVEPSSWEEFEKALAKIAVPQKVFVKEPVFESLKHIFGKDVEVQVSL
jgi:hypothetical protein